MSKGANVFPRGMIGCAHVVAALMAEPQSVSTLAEKFQVSNKNNLSYIVWRLHRMQHLHIAAWERGLGNRPVAVWTFGEGVDAPAPASAIRLPATIPMRIGAYNFGLVLAALKDGHTVMSLYELLGLHRQHTGTLIRELHRLKAVHITGWERRGNRGGFPLPIFTLGKGEDRRRPTPLSCAERNRICARRQAESRRIQRLYIDMGAIRVPEPAAFRLAA